MNNRLPIRNTTLAGCNFTTIMNQQTTTLYFFCTLLLCIFFPNTSNQVYALEIMALVANEDTVATPQNIAVTIEVLLNDVDTDDNRISLVSLGNPPNHGIAQTNLSEETIIYTPNIDFVGIDQFTYIIENDLSESATGTVTVIVDAQAALPPVANDDAFTTTESIAIPLDVLANDEGNNLTVMVESMPADGLLMTDAAGTISYLPNVGFVGVDEFMYTAIDGENGLPSNIATVTITVEAAPQPNSIAVDDSVTTAQNTPIDIDVLANDTLFDANLSISTPPLHGVAEVTTNGTINYMPNTDFAGIDQFVYILTDNNTDEVNSALVTVIVAEATPNNPPIANDDEAETFNNESASIDILANDEGENLLVTIVSPPSNGTAIIDANNQLIYTPDSSFSGLDTLTYQIEDSVTGETAQAQVFITVIAGTAIDFEAGDDLINTDAGSGITINVLDNDVSSTDAEIIVSIIGGPNNGTASINSDGSITYQPNEGFVGSDTIIYVITDVNTGQTDTAQVVIHVTPNPSNPPVANDDAATTAPNTPVEIAVMANDEGTNLIISAVNQPANGSVSTNLDNTITYTPNIGFVGVDQFTYILFDFTTDLSDTATVTINIFGAPTAPIAVNDTATVLEANSITLDILANDSGQNISIDSVATPTNGTLAIMGNSILYTPNPDFVGTEILDYIIVDENGLTDTAQIVIFVEMIAGENLPPDVVSLTACTEPLTPINICHSFTDPNGHAVAIDEDETHTTFNCSLVFINDTCFRYTPLPGFFGTDTVSIVVCDDQTPVLCSTSTLTVYVDCIAPNAEDDLVVIEDETLIINGLVMPNDNAHQGAFIPATANDSDPCEDELQVDGIIDQPINGTVELVNGEVLYTPNEGFVGSDVFTYLTCNDCGENQCDTARISVQVMADGMNACSKDTTICVPPFQSFELCADFCLEANEIESVIATANQGSVTATQSSNCYTYIAPASFETIDVVTFVACDRGNNCDTTLITISIDPDCGTNPPIAENDAVETNIDTPITIVPTENDIEPDGQELLLTSIINDDFCGNAQIAGNLIVYTPTNNCEGNQEIQYVVCDPTNLCDTASIFIQITGDKQPQGCDNILEYCTEPFTPVEICLSFCELASTDSVQIRDASTTFNCSITLIGDTCFRYTPLPGFVGGDTVKVVACNAVDICQEIKLQVNTGCVAPEAQDDFISLNNIETANIAVLNNDSDPCDRTLTATIVVNGENGTGSLDGNNIIYEPNDGFVGTDQITYVACNDCEEGQLCDTAFVNIEVLPDPNGGEPLNAEPDFVQTPFETPIDIPVLANDAGVGLHNLSIIQQSESGTLTINADNTITYTPNDGFDGEDFFLYEICDENNNCQQTTVGITVLVDSLTNQAPLANDDLVLSEPNNSITIDVTENDSDPENSDLTVTEIVEQPENGTVTINEDGTITFEPTPDFEGESIFEYVVCDAGEPPFCDTASVVVVVGTEPSNDAPIANDDEGTTSSNNPLIINILNNDADPQNQDEDTENDQILSPSIITQPANGTASIDPNTGELTYTPNPDFEGFDYIGYQLCDDGTPVLCDSAVVTISVGNTNLPPLAQDDHFQIAINTSINFSVLDNDSDPDNNINELTVTILSQPTNGTLTEADSSFSYLPNTAFQGTDTFTYVVCDPTDLCDTAIVTIEVSEKTVNAEPDVVFTTQPEAVTFNILTNDSGENISLQEILDAPDNGNITFANPENGIIIYEPNPDFTGTDHFTYFICNDDPEPICDTTTVAIIVLPNGIGNLPPTANNDEVEISVNSESVPINVLQNDSDPNGDNLTPTEIIEGATSGTVTINETTGFPIYTPNPDFEGCDRFAYVVCDDGTPSLCDTAYVQIGVGTSDCLNNAPIAFDESVTTPEDTPITIDVLANGDFDPDEDNITVTPADTPTHGTIQETEEGVFIYRPDDEFIGTDYFTYIICDDVEPVQLCDTASVRITIVPQGIDAEPDIVYTPINTPIDIGILANDSGTGLEISQILSSPNNGGISINPTTNLITYTPDSGFVGTDYFEYQICDVTDECDVTIVTIIVLPDSSLNLPPNAVNDQATTPEDTPVTIDVLSNDNNPFGGDELTIAEVGTPENGTASINPDDGTVTYIPTEDFTGIDQFPYVICDNGNPPLCDTALIVVGVGTDAPLNNPPIAVDDFETTDTNTPINMDVLGNDFDVDENDLTITFISEPNNGTTTLWENGDSLMYTPDFNFTGTDYFTYVICDNGLPAECDTAYVTILVEGDSTNNDFVIFDTIPEDTPDSLCIDDFLPAGFVVDTVSIVTIPDDGLPIFEQGNDTCLVYFPPANFTGDASFDIEACDEAGECLILEVNIHVLPVPDPPMAVNDTVTTNQNTNITILVTANDSDPEGDAITSIIPIDGPFVEGASVTPNLDNLTFDYSPAPDYFGRDSFRYLITDETGLLSDTAWVIIIIGETTDTTDIDTSNNNPMIPPISLVDDNTTTEINTPIDIPILDNDTTPVDSLINNTFVEILEEPDNGSIANSNTILEDSAATYLPNTDFIGTDSFVYRICTELDIDSIAGTDTTICDTAQVVITVNQLPNTNCELRFANFFTPNGDGTNELFLIEGLDATCLEETTFKLLIFNRWGDVVYERDNYTPILDAWDGNFNGQPNNPVPDGTYYYLLWYNFNGEDTDQAGFIEVMR